MQSKYMCFTCFQFTRVFFFNLYVFLIWKTDTENCIWTSVKGLLLPAKDRRPQVVDIRIELLSSGSRSDGIAHWKVCDLHKLIGREYEQEQCEQIVAQLQRQSTKALAPLIAHFRNYTLPGDPPSNVCIRTVLGDKIPHHWRVPVLFMKVQRF